MFQEWIQSHPVVWGETVHGKKEDKGQIWKLVESPIPGPDSFRIVWVWSSQKARHDKDTRDGMMRKAILELEKLETRLRSRKCRLHSMEDVKQAAEKALKAVLFGEGIHLSKHHDLERLVDLIRQNDATFPLFTKECAILNEYGVDARYDPRMRDEVDRDEAQEAITLAQSIVAQCRHMLET